VEQKSLIGKTVLGYTVSGLLGSGAFGTVYKVVKANVSGEYVRALKHITVPSEKQYYSVLSSMGGDASKADDYFLHMLEQIVSEIKILNSLSEKDGRYIVRYYENDIQVRKAPKRYDIFILMEYLTPLEDITQKKELCVRDAARLGADILRGLKLCHNNGVIHRDIKDDNIFAAENGAYKIGDFGVAKVLKGSSKAESLKGTPNFLAPEVYLGKEGYTKSVDLYSLGIVLYRLLNYSRNPFLPHFPEQYYAEDEDAAFEMRMNGQTPDHPSLGGKLIGDVILRSISDSEHRFQTADEFLDALNQAVDQTPDEVLNAKICFDTGAEAAELPGSPDSGSYRATMKEELPSSPVTDRPDDGGSGALNKQLFESIGETPVIPVPSVKSTVARQPDVKEQKVHKDKRVVDYARPPAIEPEPPAALDRKITGKFVFFVPVIFLLVGLAAYFIIIPKIYGQVISFVDWMFESPQDIINTLRDPNEILRKAHLIVGLRIFWYVWLAGFIASLFFAGRQLNRKPEPTAAGALLVKREPYLLACDVLDGLKHVQARVGQEKIAPLQYAVKCLAEKLSVESDFGCGNAGVTVCENNIAKQLQFLSELVPNVDKGSAEENIESMMLCVNNINAQLRRRTELKKK